jgi:uncharacterized membrane protein YfcA
MVMLGFVPLAAIGTSQVLQIIAAVSGTIGNLRFGRSTSAWPGGHARRAPA